MSQMRPLGRLGSNLQSGFYIAFNNSAAHLVTHWQRSSQLASTLIYRIRICITDQASEPT